MRLKNRKKSAAAIKSMKVGTDELKDLIKGAVKEAMGEEDDTGDDGSDTAAALDGITAEDMADIIEQAVDSANEKRKSRKDAGEEVGDLTADEVIQEAAEIIAGWPYAQQRAGRFHSSPPAADNRPDAPRCCPIPHILLQIARFYNPSQLRSFFL